MKKVARVILFLPLLVLAFLFSTIWFLYRKTAYYFCCLMLFLLNVGEKTSDFLNGNY